MSYAAVSGRARPPAGAFIGPGIYALSAGAFFYPFAEPIVALCAALCALLGSLAAVSLSRTRLRDLALAVFALVLAAVAGILHRTLDDAPWFSHWLGATQAILSANLISVGLASFSCALGLRALALRRRIFALFEVLFVGVAFAELVVAHRFGAINRPFELADSIIAQGGDPTVALLVLGAVSGALVVTLLMQERSWWRSLMHLALALCLLLIVFGSTSVLRPPPPPDGASGLGLRPNEKPSNQQQDKRGQAKPQEGKSDNEHLEFRDDYDSQGRQVPLAVVLLHDDYSPPTGMYYFRQTAFSQYNGKRLVGAMRPGVDTDVAPAFVSQQTDLAPVPNLAGDRVELDTTVALLADHTRPFALESAERFTPLQNPDSARFRRVYRVTSSALNTKPATLLGRRLGDPAWPEDVRAHYTQPPKDPRYQKLADEILSTLRPELREDGVARALAVSVWLSKEGTYSLKSGHAGADDPTADFLFGDRVGYCVHFAHAAVYLMRTLGIPSRVGAGYVVDEAARQGGSSILITGANSHAWPEVYIDGVGWVVDDVAPQHSLDSPPPPPDPDLQRLLGEMARGMKPLPQGEEHALEPLIASARALRDAILRGMALLVLAALLVLYVIKLWRRAAPLLPGAAPARVGYRADLDRLSEVALHRRFGETREGFAARIEPAVPSFRRLTERHLAAKFGASGRVDAGEVSALRRKVAAELRVGVSWWRRWLGVLSPWSWLRSK
jgi:transglutaminase-like putative cysteine protease